MWINGFTVTESTGDFLFSSLCFFLSPRCSYFVVSSPLPFSSSSLLSSHPLSLLFSVVQ